MKKIAPFALVILMFMACNNAADTGAEKKDSTNVDVNTRTNTDTSRDTSSYERMPNVTDDSLRPKR